METLGYVVEVLRIVTKFNNLGLATRCVLIASLFEDLYFKDSQPLNPEIKHNISILIF